MPLMYLAKINLNSDIFEVYNNKLNIDNVLDEIYNKISEDKTYTEVKLKEFTNSLGNKIKYEKTSKYNFAELKKDNDSKIITGKLVRTYNRPTEDFNEKGKLIDVYEEEHVGIYFYFNVRNELVAFSMRQAFGYNQFTDAFNNLLNMMIEKYHFEMFLKKDGNLLTDKLKSLKKIKRVTATLIPPNANEEELKILSDTLSYISDCKDTNAKKLKLELINTNDEDAGINMEAKMMQDTIKAAVKGYGDITAYGINHNEREQVIKSNSDAALTRVVNENISEGEYDNEADNFINSVVAELIKTNINSNKKGV